MSYSLCLVAYADSLFLSSRPPLKFFSRFLDGRFASAGADGVITNIPTESITALASEIAGQGGHMPAVICDLWDTSELVALFNDWVRIDVQ